MMAILLFLERVARFFARMFSERDQSKPSSTRFLLALVVMTFCAFIWAIIRVIWISHVVPDVPTGTLAVLTMITAVLSYLKNRNDALRSSQPS